MPAVPWRRLPQALELLRRKLSWKNLDHLTVGSTGIWTGKDKAEARKLLRGWARRVTALSDAELAHRAALAGRPGVLVIGGTGSIAVARDESNRLRRAGGWGPLLGDEGSGFWIGRCALQDPALRRRWRLDPVRLARAAAPVRAVAGLAPRVLRLARHDARARRIRDAAARRLAELAVEAGAQLRWGREVRVSWRGGLFDDDAFRLRFLAAVRRLWPRAQPQAPLLEAPEAAAGMKLTRARRRG